ncbi:MAG: hypothetical protein WC549_02120 [Actinomycetota bacterium]
MAEETKNQPKTWWKRLEFWGALGSVVSTGAMLFAPAHTVVYQAGYLLSVALGAFGLTKGYKANNLSLTKENYKIK